MGHLARIAVGLAVLVGSALVTAPARADASAWAFAGGGATGWKQGESEMAYKPSLAFDVGAGTSPDGSFILGGLFRLAPILGEGTDLALLARGATHGFQAGGFGLAIDAGGYARFWGAQSFGFAGDVVLGAPLGLQLAVNVMVGNDSAFAVGAVAGIDLLRLTVYRQSLLEWWPNPYPAQRASGEPFRALF